MKYILTLPLILFGLITTAQNFVYDNGQDVTVFADQAMMTASLYFNTPQPETILMHYEVIDKDLPSEWSYSLCGYGTCEIGVPDSGVFFEISKEQMESGEKMYFILNVQASTYDTCYVQLYVHDSQDYSRGDTVSITIVSPQSLAGINETSILDNSSVYPLPASDVLHIEMQNRISNAKAYLTNSIGETVIEKQPLDLKLNSIDISALTAGIYYLHVQDQTGILESRKIIIQK